MTAEREDELIRKIGGWGIADAPEGWRRIDMLFEVGYAHRLTIVVDANTLTGSPAPEVTPLLQELYALMDQSWTKFRLVIDPPGAYQAHFKHEPGQDTPPERRVADELLFLLPPGWESAQIQPRSALIHTVTGLTYPWTPPEGLVPEGAELVMKHPFSFTMRY